MRGRNRGWRWCGEGRRAVVRGVEGCAMRTGELVVEESVGLVDAVPLRPLGEFGAETSVVG